jgi:hypothetical protein
VYSIDIHRQEDVHGVPQGGQVKDYAVRISVAGRDGRSKVVEKSFRTEEARSAWIEKAERKDNFIEVLAYAEPEGQESR